MGRVDLNIDLMRSILWQYESAPRMIQLARNDHAAVDRLHRKFWNMWVSGVFNVPSCSSFGASVWSYILDCPIRLTEGKKTRPGFGFGAHHANFGRGNFSGRVYDFVDLLTLPEARQVLLLRWAMQTTYPSIGNAVDVVDRVFGVGTVRIEDIGSMWMMCRFSGDISRRMLKAIRKYDLLPRPAGVRLLISLEA